MATKDDIIKHLARQLYRKAERMRRCGLDPVPGENGTLHLTQDEINSVFVMVYGEDWKEKLCEEVEVHPDFADLD